MTDAKPPTSPPPAAVAAPSLRNLAAFWGTIFWLPMLLPLLAVLLTSPAGRTDMPKFLQVAIAPLLVTLLAAWWWAVRGRRIGSGAFVLTAFWQGTVVLLLLLAVITLASGSGAGQRLPDAADVESLLEFAVGASLYLLLLGAVVVWRARRRLGEMRVAATPAEISRRVPRALLALLGPTLLCAPLLALLYFDTLQRAQESATLSDQIGRVRAQIPDLQDIEKTRAHVLARKQILEETESAVPRSAAALAVAGDLPPGLRLTALQADGDTLALTVADATADNELALIERLSVHGWRGIRVFAPTAGEDTGTARIEARWPHEAAR